MVDHARCNSCGGSTPVGCTTFTLARRIVTRNEQNIQKVLIGESVSQLCPLCQIGCTTGLIEFGSIMPPLLRIEETKMSDYLWRMAVGIEIPPLQKLPLECVACQESIQIRSRFVYIELSLDSTEEHWVRRERKVAVANVCRVCVHRIWAVQVEMGKLNTIPCSTLSCPFCTPLTTTPNKAMKTRPVKAVQWGDFG